MGGASSKQGGQSGVEEVASGDMAFISRKAVAYQVSLTGEGGKQRERGRKQG